MAVEEPANGAPHGGRDQRQEHESHHEEDDLRHHGDQDPDDAEDEEEDREREVPCLVAPRARVARSLVEGFRLRREGGHPRLQ